MIKQYMGVAPSTFTTVYIKHHTVDGRHPAPPVIFETVSNMGYSLIFSVPTGYQDFFHQRVIILKCKQQGLQLQQIQSDSAKMKPPKVQLTTGVQHRSCDKKIPSSSNKKHDQLVAVVGSPKKGKAAWFAQFFWTPLFWRISERPQN